MSLFNYLVPMYEDKQARGRRRRRRRGNSRSKLPRMEHQATVGHQAAVGHQTAVGHQAAIGHQAAVDRSSLAGGVDYMTAKTCQPDVASGAARGFQRALARHT
jgi:hypothetical protein